MPFLIEALMMRMQKSRTDRSLRELDDRLLRDIGLTRHEVAAISKNHNFAIRNFSL